MECGAATDDALRILVTGRQPSRDTGAPEYPALARVVDDGASRANNATDSLAQQLGCYRSDAVKKSVLAGMHYRLVSGSRSFISQEIKDRLPLRGQRRLCDGSTIKTLFETRTRLPMSPSFVIRSGGTCADGGHCK
jgi:hypothetical protein